MEYTIKKLSSLAGISTRTLRYYDEIGLLKPARKNSSGYRIYGQVEVDSLQQILFYRELGLDLNTIGNALKDPAFDRVFTLKAHHRHLLEKRQQLELLLKNVEKTISAAEGGTVIMDQEKFEGFKQQLIDSNEEKYGSETRKKYGEETVGRSNRQLKNMSQEDFERVTQLEQNLFAVLAEAMETGDPTSGPAQRAADLHKQWLTYYWGSYNPEAHAGLGEIYVADARFQAYYDKQREGTAAFLRDAINIYTKK